MNRPVPLTATVPVETVEFLAERRALRPGARALALTQDSLEIVRLLCDVTLRMIEGELYQLTKNGDACGFDTTGGGGASTSPTDPAAASSGVGSGI